MTLLDFERLERRLPSPPTSASSNCSSSSGASAAPAKPTATSSSHRLADLWVANETGRLLAYRIAWMQEAGRIPNYEASVIKVFATELAQRITNFGVNIFGPAGALEPDSKYAVANGVFEKGHLVNVAPTIYSGSSEIHAEHHRPARTSASRATESAAGIIAA
ncbi:acyl-CoA dehydrogenase family protein [Tepidiforma flava]|uniref:Acyl-CoA dehydrogenase family protein n=1 Tax=Tepidiforma flava TaxID=3004094 RepID=A0ABY7M5W8_9CHLR|nr:acyl-CoA dehydrogenase family protein [Tepidiforma flava]WBL35013.1 acyl-CoA dehydrogenase family protein [Tepidiforma flava]